MADEITNPATEIIPSLKGGVSGIASALAPVILVDEFSTYGQYNGIAHITCEVVRFLAHHGVPTNDRVVVAHLRMNLHALAGLKSAIEKIEEMLARDGKSLPVFGVPK